MKRLLIVGVCVLGLSGMAYAMDAKQPPSTNSTTHMSTPVKHSPAKNVNEPAKNMTTPVKNTSDKITPATSHETVKK